LHTSYCSYEAVKQRQNLGGVQQVNRSSQEWLSFRKKSKKWKELAEAVVAKDGLPVYTVGKPGVRQMIKSRDPRCQLAGRKHFS